MIGCAAELKDAVIGGEFGSSRDPCILDARFRNLQSIVSQSRGYVTLSSQGYIRLSVCLSVYSYVCVSCVCLDDGDIMSRLCPRVTLKDYSERY